MFSNRMVPQESQQKVSFMACLLIRLLKMLSSWFIDGAKGSWTRLSGSRVTLCSLQLKMTQVGEILNAS